MSVQLNTRIPDELATALGVLSGDSGMSVSALVREALGDAMTARLLFGAGCNALPCATLHSLLVTARELERDRDVDTRCAAMAWRQRCALIAVRVAEGTAGTADITGCLTGVPECVIDRLALSCAALKDSK